MALSSNVKASLAKGGQNIVISRAGRAVLRYTGLLATDAGGRALHSWLALDGGRLLLRVDAAGARYPLRIDPLIQQGEKLTGAGEIASGRFGYSVALSADGNTALIGARYAIGTTTKPGRRGYSRARAPPGPSRAESSRHGPPGETLFDHIGEGEFGYSVALSADGDTALIGAPDDNGGATNEGGVGAAWVFTRSGSTWTQQGEKLTGTGETGEGEFGTSVALSADGNTALIGAPADNGDAGAAWVFTRSGSTWTQQGEKLVGDAPRAAPTRRGRDRRRRIRHKRGAVRRRQHRADRRAGDNGGAGAAWVFTRSGSTWTQQGEKLAGLHQRCATRARARPEKANSATAWRSPPTATRR